MNPGADVIVLGGGLAGCRAALEAAAGGAEVIMLTPTMPGQTGNSSRASGGFATALPPNDDWRAHYDDFLGGGYGINDPALVEIVARHAAAALDSLAGLVDGFQMADGGFELKQVPAHDRPRSAQYGLGMDRLMTTLGERLVLRGVRIVTGQVPVALLQDRGGRVCGAVSLAEDGTRAEFSGKAVVLASGGCGDLFPVTSNAPGVCGEGYAMALRAGCRLRDMEFIQFTPTAFAAPPALRGQTIVGSLLSLPGVELRNSQHARFMRDYDPDNLERADRATLARAIHREIQAGRGSAAGGVFLDLSTVPADELDRHRPGFLEWLHAHGIDPSAEPLQTAPSAHTCLGGVAVDATLAAAPGLYVAGEALGGTHGANRLSSNSLTEANVTGCLAGRHAAEYARTLDATPRPVPAGEDRHVAPAETAALGGELKRIMGDAAGVEREARALDEGLARLEELGRQFETGGGDGESPAASAAANRILVCRTILSGARLRTETRGCHCRRDFPQPDDRAWQGNLFARLDKGRLALSYRPL